MICAILFRKCMSSVQFLSKMGHERSTLCSAAFHSFIGFQWRVKANLYDRYIVQMDQYIYCVFCTTGNERAELLLWIAAMLHFIAPLFVPSVMMEHNGTGLWSKVVQEFSLERQKQILHFAPASLKGWEEWTGSIWPGSCSPWPSLARY